MRRVRLVLLDLRDNLEARELLVTPDSLDLLDQQATKVSKDLLAQVEPQVQLEQRGLRDLQVKPD